MGNRALSRLLTPSEGTDATAGGGGVGARRGSPEIAALVHRTNAAGTIQLVRQKVRPLRKADGVSVEALEAFRATIEAQILDLDPQEVALGFVDMARIGEWQTQYTAALASLRTDLLAAGHGDDHAILPDEVMARATPLARRFFAAYVRLMNIRNALNESFDGYAIHRETQEALAEGSALSEEKKRARDSEVESGSTGSDPSSTTAEKVIAFPHNGKHAPPRGMVDRIRSLEEATDGRGKTALYLTNDPPTVVGWENTARSEGLLLSDGFTVVHRFDHIVGADQGSATHCVRIDGDHGHPIIESGSKTGFDSYIQRTVDHYIKQGDHEALKRVAAYLTSVGLDPRTYRIPQEDCS